MSPRIGITQEDVIKTAIELANTEGLKEVTMANLAKALHIKSPSLYNHIKGLPELMEILTLKALEDLYKRMKDSQNHVGKKEALLAICQEYLSFAREQPGLYELTIESTIKKREEIQILSNQIIELLTEVLLPYQLNAEETIHAIRGLRSILHGFASIESNNGFGMNINTNASFHFLLSTYIKGLRNTKEISD
ncbi:TetR/AcrR family transcriptional regulator [Bacillus sp. B1-b2]|uniref:TetR/AcrR family transcriptional regulator n=1 Tax=Bacillus sp. B1-b2 TaxID=2653201 RepID=UPI001261FAAF|nr:TetR/AcrR family transcriptional regulator [Bacillus sp. B1-b2]KAB7667788.1 TetR/AcrR family transcriptional regulator [Bacillus sp. B1-b2]